jgi:hypothetical protein
MLLNIIVLFLVGERRAVLRTRTLVGIADAGHLARSHLPDIL